MTTTRNYEKEAKAVEIIANEIAEIVKMLYKLEMADEPEDDQERMELIKALVDAALEKTGK